MNPQEPLAPTKPKDLFESVAEVVDDLQDQVDRLNKTEDLISLLLGKSFPLPGISAAELSIVYREYGSGEYRSLAYQGELMSELPKQTAFLPDNDAIKQVVEYSAGINQNYPYFPNAADCEAKGFSGYSTVLIVPMRIDKQRCMGAFVVHHPTKSDAFDPLTRRALDILSDRLARLIQSLHQRQRAEVFNKLRNALLMRLATSSSFEHESQILTAVAQAIGQWYRHDQIYFLIKNPLYTDSYYLANRLDKKAVDQDFIIPNFRLEKPLDRSDAQLLGIVGGLDNLEAMIHANGGEPYQGGIKTSPAPELPEIFPACKSWLGVTLHHPDGYVFGHLVLHNLNMALAYESGDLRFMDAVADFTGFLLAAFRTKKKEKVIQELDQKKLEGSKELCEQQLTQLVVDYLHSAYGVKDFSILAVDSAKQEWKVLWSSGMELIAHNIEFQSEVFKKANKFRMQPEKYSEADFTFEYESEKYLITPMRTGFGEDDWIVVGAFIIPSRKPGKVVTQIIDEVSDALGRRLKTLHNQVRYEALTRFVNTVSQLPSSSLTEEQVLQIAYTHISQVMFSENIYIALYDEQEDVISFPLIYQQGKIWEAMHGTTRKINRTQLGRTEVLILDPQPLLIKTKAESEAWYQQANHKEHAGNPLVSWVGVPIFAVSEGGKQKVRGVIAAYHDQLEYVYSIRDVFFLQNVAGSVAGLFGRLDLKNANQRLEEVNAVVNNNEKSLQRSQMYLLQDMSFRTSRNLGLARRQVSQAIHDVGQASTSGDIKTLKFTLEGLNAAELAITQTSTYARMMASKEQSDFSLGELIEVILKQIIAYREITIDFIINGNATVQTKYWVLFDSLYNIFDDLLNKLNENKILIITINIDQDEDKATLFRIIYDFAYPTFSSEDLNAIPNEEKLPYWRALNNLRGINGELSIFTNDSKGQIDIKLKKQITSENTPHSIVIYDPEMGNLFSRWLLSSGKYTVYNLSSITEISKYSDSSLLLIVNMSFFKKSEQLNELEGYIKKVEFMRLILVFDEKPSDYGSLTIYEPSIIVKYDNNLDIIGRLAFMNVIELPEKESGK